MSLSNVQQANIISRQLTWLAQSTDMKSRIHRCNNISKKSLGEIEFWAIFQTFAWNSRITNATAIRGRLRDYNIMNRYVSNKNAGKTSIVKIKFL